MVKENLHRRRYKKEKVITHLEGKDPVSLSQMIFGPILKKQQTVITNPKNLTTNQKKVTLNIEKKDFFINLGKICKQRLKKHVSVIKKSIRKLIGLLKLFKDRKKLSNLSSDKKLSKFLAKTPTEIFFFTLIRNRNKKEKDSHK